MSTAAAPDALHRGTLSFKQHGVAVQLEVLEGVFAAAAVDAGTRHLLRWLAADRYRDVRSVLDLGCGYGPLGLWLAAAEPTRTVLAVDRDARALAATRLGADRNGLDARVEVRGSLGYDDVGVDERFDLVVSNIPAKVGGAALGHLVVDARRHLVPDGLAAVVVVERLVPEVDALLLDDAVECLDRRAARGYTAYEYRFTGPPAGGLGDGSTAFDDGAYGRGRHEFRFDDLRWEAEVSFSIPDFDSVGRGAQAALDLLVGRAAPRLPAGPTTVAGVGQGHLPAALRAAGHVGELRLVDRDLLALRTAAANVPGRAPVLHHVPGPTSAAFEGAELAVVELPEREPVAVTAALLGAALAAVPGLDVVVHGRSADVSRVLELLRRHGARLDGATRSKVGQHAAVRGRVAPTRATPPA